MRLVEQRATGQFLKVEGLPGIVVSVPGWMIDPIVCAGMRTGQPQVDLAALSDLKRLVMPAAAPAHFPSGNGFAREEVDEAARRAFAEFGKADEPDVLTQQNRRYGGRGAGGGRDHACPDPDAGRRLGRGGSR